jgi:hypothetical protein
VALNLLAMFLFATLLVPILRRGITQVREANRSPLNHSLASATISPAPPATTNMIGRDIRLQVIEARSHREQAPRKQREEEILRRVFESNLLLRR